VDWTKRLSTSLFYLPSQAEDPRYSFFTYYNEEVRIPLDPLPWIKNASIALQPEPKWRNAPVGKGNESFFRLGLECKRAGMSLNDIGTLPREEALFPDLVDILAKIRALMAGENDNSITNTTRSEQAHVSQAMEEELSTICDGCGQRLVRDVRSRLRTTLGRERPVCPQMLGDLLSSWSEMHLGERRYVIHIDK
jgi:hypothetical protein